MTQCTPLADVVCDTLRNPALVIRLHCLVHRAAERCRTSWQVIPARDALAAQQARGVMITDRCCCFGARCSIATCAWHTC